MSSKSYPKRTLHLSQSELFAQPLHYTDQTSRAYQSYEKARAVGRSYGRDLPLPTLSPTHRYYTTMSSCLTNVFPPPGVTIDDILNLTPKFWQLHNDPISLLDGGAMTLLTIQYNLCSGTIARYREHRPELGSLVNDLLQYRKQLSLFLASRHSSDKASYDIALVDSSCLLSWDMVWMSSTSRPRRHFFPPASSSCILLRQPPQSTVLALS